VADILRAVPVSRRALEMKFQRHLGHSPHEAIWRAHVAHAQQLLVETDLNAMQVAVRSGFASASALASVFKRRVGMTPMTYRRRHRTGEAE
jgi:LacI family transcriptional regulator